TAPRVRASRHLRPVPSTRRARRCLRSQDQPTRDAGRACACTHTMPGASPDRGCANWRMNGTAVWALRRSASGAPILLLSLPLLGVARLLPENGFGLWLRLVAASLVLLLPGALLARALHLRGASATVAWGLGALGPALLLVFVVHSSILLALAVLGVVGVVALPFALRVVSGPPAWDTLVVAFCGLAFGIALWHVAGVVSGDALFHLGRVQKLYSFGDLHVRSVDEFADGGLHPGY